MSSDIEDTTARNPILESIRTTPLHAPEDDCALASVLGSFHLNDLRCTLANAHNVVATLLAKALEIAKSGGLIKDFKQDAQPD